MHTADDLGHREVSVDVLVQTMQGVPRMENSTRSATAGNSVLTPQQQLEALRTELDGIDSALLEVVRDRIELCCRIAVLKRRHSIPMMQPRRVGAVHEHARTYALSHDLSPEFLDDLYDVLITETCRVEDLIIDADGEIDVAAVAPLRHDA
ncbi:chorismate mutase [Rhodococcus tukisamuensis]|uniref:Chorismate mutase n=2 Tax=Rhodococcus tukisamuensis TaxID=168276 RepID=A0A1G6UK34_9NOCA|nr:chorismate mutase [Rhodococcus tukisamuensis]